MFSSNLILRLIKKKKVTISHNPLYYQCLYSFKCVYTQDLTVGNDNLFILEKKSSKHHGYNVMYIYKEKSGTIYRLSFSPYAVCKS